MSFYLRILEGRNQGEEYRLLAGETQVGRSREAKVRVLDADVSGKHFRLNISDSGIKIYDTSSFGTFVDGAKVNGEAAVRSGQVIAAGKTAKFMLVEVKDDEDAAEENGDSIYLAQFGADAMQDVDGDDKTSVTKFVPDASVDSKTDFSGESEHTAVTRFVEDTNQGGDASVGGEGTSVEGQNGQRDQTAVEDSTETEVKGEPYAGGDKSSTCVQTDVSDASAFPMGHERNVSRQASPKGEGWGDGRMFTDGAGANRFPGAPSDGQDNVSGAAQTIVVGDGDGADENATDNGNGTLSQGTVILTPEQVEKIRKEQRLKRQRQQFFRFVVIMMFLVCLGAMWVLKTPKIETELSWPQRGKKYLTDYCPAWVGSEDGGFDVYYPQWKKNAVSQEENRIAVRTYLGIKGDVPLNITVRREKNASYVYENRASAMSSAQKRLAEAEAGSFSFETGSLLFFMTSGEGGNENGIPCRITRYQRENNGSWFGVLTFFRHGSCNYVVCAEVPAGETFRAQSVLFGERFVSFSKEFVTTHWEGDDTYHRGGDIGHTIFDIRDKLVNHKSERSYSVLELMTKGVLAQATYNELNNEYREGLELLKLLREKQFLYYNGLKIRWNRARTEEDKRIIYNDGMAVFSLKSDKRNYDIARGVWE